MIKKAVVLSILCPMIFACQSNTGSEDAQTRDSKDEVTDISEADSEQLAIKIYPKEEIAPFPKASLTLQQPMNGSSIESSEVAFDFMVEGYELGDQTEEAKMNLANSDKGQHIHLIIDNDPYSAHYEAGFTKTMEMGHHYAIAFLSRSYHESVKNPNAFEVFQFTVGDMATDKSNLDLSLPGLFYSRPKGTYTGEGTKKVLLDFYLHNASISPDGNKVKVIVNDEHEFILDQWQAYIIEGLPMGENTIYMELIDDTGAKMDVPINSITRTFNLEA